MSFRRSLPVLVADAQAIGSIGVIRSLGRAGYPVLAYAQQATALGLHSRYLQQGLLAPPYSERQAFLQWLRATVAGHGIRALVPSEGLLLALQQDFAEFAHLLPLSQSAHTVYTGMSKYDLFAGFFTGGGALLDNIPDSALLEPGSELPPGLQRHARIYAKIDACHSRDGNGAVVALPGGPGLAERLQPLLEKCPKILLQAHVEGQGVGIFLLRWRGKLLARFGHQRLHEVPHTGGASSYRRSWWQQAVYEDAVRRVEHLDWDGVAMLEYRFDHASGKFYLMEMNGRFWGSLHLALFAGVDFPRLLLDAFHGHAEAQQGEAHDLACRLTYPKEMEYVLSCLKDGRLPLRKRLWPVLEFFLLGLDPRVRSDLWFPGDRGLYWRSIPRAIKRFLS